ncbi:hypothetical protein MSAN_00592500 [Mycena sanguinolenta]|uniref:Uncharacterized protein n=1 Tax=Mycena sanguinolenta TaxID=230812 RepID=A0A8H6Z7M2_9AGAR|nr:hypothetical protein MSAN_00592500 [Mycena sanguinolenta]
MTSTSSPGLSDADALLLKGYGQITISDVLGILFEGVFCGAYGIFFALAVYSIRQRGFRTRRAMIMALVVVYLYAASVTAWAVDCYIAFKDIHSLYMTTEIPLPDREDLAFDTFNKFVGVQETIFVFNAIVADAVVIWRTWAIYGGRITAIVTPCVLLLTAFVFALVDVTCNFYHGSTPLPGANSVCVQSQKIVWAFSLATNVVCTLFIAFKAWEHRKTMKQLNFIGKKYHGMSAENILSLLVESGFIYSLLWTIQIIGYLDFDLNSPWYYISIVVVRLGRQTTGMYPTLIIVIVNLKRTIWEEHPTTLDEPTIPNSLQWAVNITRSGTTATINARPEVGIHLDVIRENAGIHKQPAADEI